MSLDWRDAPRWLVGRASAARSDKPRGAAYCKPGGGLRLTKHVSVSVLEPGNRLLRRSGPEVIAIGVFIPMSVPVDGHPVAGPTSILEFPSLLNCPDHRCGSRRGQFTNVQIDARFHDTRFLDEVERDWITLELIGHVDKLVEIGFESWACLIRTDFSMADDMIAVARDSPSSANLIDQPGAGFVQRLGPRRIGSSFMLDDDRILVWIDIELQQSPGRGDDAARVPSSIALTDILMDLSVFPDAVVGGEPGLLV